MLTNQLKIKLVTALNLYSLFLICVILIIAHTLQIVYNELPCPLCLFQRAGLMCVAFAYLLNILYGPKPLHYAIATIAATIAAFIAFKQIALHIAPGTGFYGPKEFGFHLYTWVVFICMASIIWNMILLLLIPVKPDALKVKFSKRSKIIAISIIAIYFIVISVNLISSFLECGLNIKCPADPTHYILLDIIKSWF
jgi:hypothetical protein